MANPDVGSDMVDMIYIIASIINFFFIFLMLEQKRFKRFAYQIVYHLTTSSFYRVTYDMSFDDLKIELVLMIKNLNILFILVCGPIA